MPKIDFYRIYDATPKAILTLACKLLEKAYQQKNNVYVNTSDEPTAHQLNESLWTFHDTSFIPHQLLGEKHTPTPPIEIGYESSYQPKHHDILLNLDTNIPPFFAEFERIIEIISEEEKQKENARNKYRQYNQQGYEIKIHDLKERL
jgi:DNA polymerase-3 subunit chi